MNEKSKAKPETKSVKNKDTARNSETNAKQSSFQRFSLNFRLQHIFLLTSTLVLIFTGLPILMFFKHPEWTWWSRESMASWEMINAVRLIHRGAGAVLLLTCLYHIFFITCTREGRREFCQLIPCWSDFVHVTHNLLYFLGMRRETPYFGRYTYYEKFDYWAVYWGCVIMVGSGLGLWFDRVGEKFFPWLPYDLAVVLHSEEAILATLALLIWHMYNVHLRPGIFPGSRVWLDGKISREDMEEVHPAELAELEKDSKPEA